MKENKLSKHKLDKRYQFSLLLILISFVWLFVISFRAIKIQEKLLKSQNRDKLLLQLDQISRDYFARIATDPLPVWAVPMPMETSAFPILQVPDGISARATLMKMVRDPQARLLLVTEAELNASPHEQEFWRFLLLKEHIKDSNFFQGRKVAFSILNSNFDYLLPDGRTLKTHAAITAAATFLTENNREAFFQWLYRLRALPAPSVIPENAEQLFPGKMPEEAKTWLNFLILCYQKTYAANLSPGWVKSENSAAFIFNLQNSLVALPQKEVIKGLANRFAEIGFAYLGEPQTEKLSSDAHLLADSMGLFIDVPMPIGEPVPGGFFVLFLLTMIGMLGLFRFSLFEWQFIQKRNLLDEEEKFFRQTAHDIKTPLTTVRCLAETVALKRYKSEEQCDRYLHQLLTESERAAELIDQLLLSVRLKKQTINPDIKRLSPGSRLQDLILRFKPRLVGFEIIEDFSDYPEIMADPDMFDRVMVNLIENVIKHAVSGHFISLKLEQKNGRVAVIIGDHGPGLAALESDSKRKDLMTEDLPYNPNRGGSGTGILLVKQIMKIHAGDFYAETNADIGMSIITTWRSSENG